MSKPISKVAVRCPHCGAEQQEPELAKSTFCRKCSEYFAITPATLASAAKSAQGLRQEAKPRYGASSAVRDAASAVPSRQTSSTGEPPASGLLQKFEGLFGKPKTRTVDCFNCSSSQEVTGSAQSTTCRSCGAYIDLQDYRVNGSFSRNIQTRGSVYLGAKGDLSSSKIICTDAQIYGKMRGNMQARGKVLIKFQGRLAGSLEAGLLTIEKGSEVIFSRPIKAASVIIAGKMSGMIISTSQVIIHKTGSLDGGVVATGFNVERGGCFQGELTIRPRGAVAGADETDISGAPTSRNSRPAGDLNAFIAGGEQSLALG